VLLIGVLGPPVASLILLTTHYLLSCAGRIEPVDLPCFVVTYVFFAVPVGYVFGLVPALLSGVMYCGALTAMTKLRTQMLLRVCTGATSGGLAGGVWFHAVIGPYSHGYGAVAAAVAALLSLRWPAAQGVTGTRDAAIEAEQFQRAQPELAKIRMQRIQQIIPFLGHDCRWHLQHRALATFQPLPTHSLQLRRRICCEPFGRQITSRDGLNTHAPRNGGTSQNRSRHPTAAAIVNRVLENCQGNTRRRVHNRPTSPGPPAARVKPSLTAE
jgi:hypothetical protein